MEIEAFQDQSLRIMVPFCQGSAPGGTCYFDEFVDYIQQAQSKLLDGQKTTFKQNLWPDAEAAAKELTGLKMSNGKTYSGKHSSQKLTSVPRCPGIFESAVWWIGRVCHFCAVWMR